MNVNVSFRHMESSDAAREYAVGKLERVVGKYVRGRIDADIVLSVEKFRNIANITLQIKNLTVKANTSSEDMYASIDMVMDKIERQLRRHKDRLRDHKPSQGAARSFRMSVVRPAEGELSEVFEDEFEDYAASAVSEAAEVVEVTESETPGEPAAAVVEAPREQVGTFETMHGEVNVTRPRSYEAKSLNVEEAVIQLDLMEGREFLVFTNVDTERINIMYRRGDGTYGLIET